MDFIVFAAAVAAAYIAGRKRWSFRTFTQAKPEAPAIPPGVYARLLEYDLSKNRERLERHTRLVLRAFGPGLVRNPPLQGPLPTHDDRSSYLKDSIRISARRYGVKLDRLHVRFTRNRVGNEAGSFQQRSEGFFVDVLEQYKEQDIALTIIAAHEIAHYAMFQKHIEIPDRAENEDLTDTLVALAGYGPIMLQAYHREYSVVSGTTISTTTDTMGYLHPTAVAYLTVLQMEFAGLNPREHLNPEDPWYAHALNERESAKRDAKSRSCRLCGTDLPAPDPGSVWLTRCPLCEIIQRA